jgi:hypothetical protein
VPGAGEPSHTVVVAASAGEAAAITMAPHPSNVESILMDRPSPVDFGLDHPA